MSSGLPNDYRAFFYRRISGLLNDYLALPGGVQVFLMTIAFFGGAQVILMTIELFPEDLRSSL